MRIAMTLGERRNSGITNGNLLTVKSENVPIGDEAADVTFIERQGVILPDLTIGANVDSTTSLKANAGLSNRGVQLYGAGFIVDEEDAKIMMASDTDKTKTTIRPYVNGRDLAANGRGVLVIDFFGFTETEALEQNPSAFQRVLERVKPERDESREPQVKKKWWLYGRTRDEMRESVKHLRRFIITLRVSKHNFFVFLDSDTLPDDRIVTVASDDAYHLGVLSSKIHTSWSLASGSRLGVGNDPIYNNSRCFDPFPFPDATPEQQARIRELAEQLDAHRKRQQATHTTLTLTDLYNVVEKLRAGESLTAKDQIINQQGLASVVLSLHQQIDAAVTDAYGWPHNLPDSEILTRLVRLNHERAAEEAAGQIRYLRPSYQAPGQQQLGIDLPTSAAAISAPVAAASQQEWPKELAQQMQAVRDAVQQAGVSINAKQVAALFQRTNAGKVQPLLDTLAMLALVRQTPEGAYAV